MRPSCTHGICDQRGASVGAAVVSGCGFRDVCYQEGHVESIREVASDLQAARRGAEEMTTKSAGREVKISEWNLKMQLFTEKAERAGDLQNHLNDKTKELESPERHWEAKESALKEKICNEGSDEVKLKAARAAIDHLRV